MESFTEMEAMWISFDCDPSDKFAIRPYFGGVNGISGQSIVSELQKRDSTLPMSQDYITLPDQKRLDGIAVSPGTVKQCVATATTAARREMPRSSSTFNTPIRSGGKAAKDGPQPASPEGMTIEWQMTGRDEVGGIQLQIIPQFQVEDMFAGSVKDACPRRHGRPIKSYQAVPESAADYDVLKTPEELNLRDGDFIHLRNLAQGKNPSRGKVVGDLLAEGPENTSDTLNLEVFRKPSFERILEIRDVELATKSVSFKVRARKRCTGFLMTAYSGVFRRRFRRHLGSCSRDISLIEQPFSHDKLSGQQSQPSPSRSQLEPPCFPH